MCVVDDQYTQVKLILNSCSLFFSSSHEELTPEPLVLNMLCIKLDFFYREVNTFILSGWLRELKKKGKDHPVIHKNSAVGYESFS